jgi:hypothetical protein
MILALAVSTHTARASSGSGAPPVPKGARTHDGFYLHGGVSVGRTWLRYDAPLNTGIHHHGRAFGGATGAEIAAGWTLPFGLVLGGVVFGHSQGDMDFDNPDVSRGWDWSTTGMTGAGAFARWYPLPHWGFHVDALAGAVVHRTRHRVYVVTHVPWSCPIILVTCTGIEGKEVVRVEESKGYELGIGAGYGIWFANQWSFDLTGRMFVAHTWKRERDYWFYMPTLGLGVTYH